VNVSFPFLSKRFFFISRAFLFRFFTVSFPFLSPTFLFRFNRLFCVSFVFLFRFFSYLLISNDMFLHILNVSLPFPKHFHTFSSPFLYRFQSVSLPFHSTFLFRFTQRFFSVSSQQKKW